MPNVSSKGQLTLPVDIRRHMQLQPGDKVRFTPSGTSTVTLERVPLEPARKKGSP